jgi:hypothetical protein
MTKILTQAASAGDAPAARLRSTSVEATVLVSQ